MALTLTERDAALEAARPGLERLARRLVWHDEDARDVVQAAMVDALARWATLNDPGATAAWLRRIVVNRAMSLLRRRKVWRALGALLLVDEPLAPSAEEVAEGHAHRQALAHALAALPPRQSTAFSLRYLEGLQLDEVARVMGIDRGTVRVHVQRAVRALRQRGLLLAAGETI